MSLRWIAVALALAIFAKTYWLGPADTLDRVLAGLCLPFIIFGDAPIRLAALLSVRRPIPGDWHYIRTGQWPGRNDESEADR